MTGYGSPGYAASLAEFGAPRELPRSSGWILERPVNGTGYRDAMGCYPLFCCADWSLLEADLAELGGSLVSLAVVTDPFAAVDPDRLKRSFTEVMFPFKEHYVADLSLPLEEIAGRRHRKNARRALREVTVTACDDPARFVDTWTELYGNLVKRHQVTGIQAFSRRAFEAQLSLPGAVVLVAECRGETVGAQVYFQQGDAVHCHLGAVSERGYDLGAFFALDLVSIEYFADRARWLNFGGGAGISGDGADGLSLYKKGWATETRTAFFCGRIFDRAAYQSIVRERGIAPTSYFPAYRKGEFG